MSTPEEIVARYESVDPIESTKHLKWPHNFIKNLEDLIEVVEADEAIRAAVKEAAKADDE